MSGSDYRRNRSVPTAEFFVSNAKNWNLEWNVVREPLPPATVREVSNAVVLPLRVRKDSTTSHHLFEGGLCEADGTFVAELRCVDEVFKEESLDLKADYIKKYKADVLVMGDDWAGKFDWVVPLTGCEVVYLPRTPAISTTAIIEKIRG